MMIRHTILAATVGTLLSGITSVAAADSGFYFGVTGGQAKADLSQEALDDGVTNTLISGRSDLEDTDFSWSLLGGYRFTRNFAVEASYLDLGTSEYRATGSINPPGPIPSATANYSADFEVAGFTAAGVATVPLSQMFQLQARVGVLFTDLEISQRAAVTGFSSNSETDSTDSRDFFFGVGAGLNLGAQWSVSLDWQRFKDVGDEDESGETDIDRVSLGVTYRL